MSSFEKLFSANQNMNTVRIKLYFSHGNEHQPEKNAAVIDRSNPLGTLKYYARVIRCMYSLQWIEVVELSA